jgi:YHS domain-containing protein
MNSALKPRFSIRRAVVATGAGSLAIAAAIATFPGVARMAPKDPTALYNVRASKPIAVRGYDVVEYHRSGQAAKGREDLSLVREGITYRFATDKNLKSFEVNPKAYMPAHGGWCSSAMAFGRKVDIDPESFIVENGRLFLFYKGIRGDAKKDWLENQPQWLTDADAQWGKLSGEKPIDGIE